MKISFTPAVYEHAARFVNRTPWEVSRDPELLFEGHRRAYLQYRHQVIVVGIDIYNLEAEAYGAVIEPCEGDAIPAIHDPMFKSIDDALGVKPFDPERAGRIPMAICGRAAFEEGVSASRCSDSRGRAVFHCVQPARHFAALRERRTAARRTRRRC